jgi:hypothetical protein
MNTADTFKPYESEFLEMLITCSSRTAHGPRRTYRTLTCKQICARSGGFSRLPLAVTGIF